MRHHTRRSLVLLRPPLPICWKIWPVVAKVVFLVTVGCSHGGLAQGKSQQGATETMITPHTPLLSLGQRWSALHTPLPNHQSHMA